MTRGQLRAGFQRTVHDGVLARPARPKASTMPPPIPRGHAIHPPRGVVSDPFCLARNRTRGDEPIDPLIIVDAVMARVTCGPPNFLNPTCANQHS